MATLDTTRNYNDGEVLVRADLDAFLDDIEAFLNVTKINDDNIQDSGITGSTKLLNSSVTASKLAADSVTTLKIADANVTTAKLADGAVTTAKITDGNITTAKLLDGGVTTAKIADSNVTTAKIADSNVTTAKLANTAVTTAKIADSAVTTAKINDGNVTRAKLEAVGQQISASCGSFSGFTGTQITNHSVTITTTGRPVFIGMISAGTSSDSGTLSITSTGAGLYWELDRGASVLCRVGVQAASVGHSIPVTGIFYIDTPAAGTYTYKAYLTTGLSMKDAKLIVYEL